MRGLAACLVGVLGLGALATMAACSDSTDMGSAGAGGSSAAAGSGSGGKAGSAGSSTTAGQGGEAGTAECGFQTVECSTCLGEKCGEQVNACGDVTSCGDALQMIPGCVCNPANDPETCIHDFVTAEGDVAQKLAECYTLNCADLCN